MMDYYMEGYYGYSWNKIYQPRNSDFTGVYTAPKSTRKFFNFSRGHHSMSERSRRNQYSASFYQAKKTKRDRARMAAFILRKTEENMPFSSLEDNDLLRLGTNNSLFTKPVLVTTDACTQTIHLEQPSSSPANDKDRLALQKQNELLGLKLKLLDDSSNGLLRMLHELQIAKDQSDSKVHYLEIEINQLQLSLSTCEEKLLDSNSEVEEWHKALDYYQHYSQSTQQYNQQQPHNYHNGGRRYRRGR